MKSIDRRHALARHALLIGGLGVALDAQER
jgi:hypothetical protein